VDRYQEALEMGLFSRAHDIIEAKANKALDKAERPDEMLDLSYEKMLEQITQVRRALVEIAASRKRIELQAEQLQHSVDHLQDQAKSALQAGREDLAREALSRKAAAVQQVEQMEPQHQQLIEEEAKLSQTLQTLQARVNQFRTQKETLKAQYTAAQAMTSVNEGVAGISKSITDSGTALSRAQDKIANMQARSSALDELLESGVLEDVGTGHDDIQRELDQIGVASSVDQELAALKASIGPAGALGAGQPEVTDAEIVEEGESR
jgi:phage shock protein A